MEKIRWFLSIKPSYLTILMVWVILCLSCMQNLFSRALHSPLIWKKSSNKPYSLSLSYKIHFCSCKFSIFIGREKPSLSVVLYLKIHWMVVSLKLQWTDSLDESESQIRANLKQVVPFLHSKVSNFTSVQNFQGPIERRPQGEVVFYPNQCCSIQSFGTYSNYFLQVWSKEVGS